MAHKWEKVVQVGGFGEDAYKSTLTPVFDGKTFRANIYAGNDVSQLSAMKNPSFGYIIECVFCNHSISIPYGDDNKSLIANAGEYLGVVWKSTRRTLYCEHGSPQEIYSLMEQRFMQITDNPDARLAGVPWNIIPRNDLKLLSPAAKELDRLDNLANQKKLRLLTAMNKRKEAEQHWATINRHGQ